MGELDRHLTYDSMWAHPSPQPKRHLDRFSRFCRANECGRQTMLLDRSVTTDRIYVRSTGDVV